MTKVENIVVEFLRKHVTLILFIAATVMGMLMRWRGMDVESIDYQAFLAPWWTQIEAGGIDGLANQVGNYNIPYQIVIYILTLLPFKSLYAYKLVSILFDFALAAGAALIVYEVRGKKSYFIPVLTYSVVFCSLAVVFNSAFWAQCDSIYVAFILFAIYFSMRDRHIACFVMLGFSLAFKLQVVFILPVFVYYYFTSKKISLLHFLIIPAVDILLCMPAVFLGRSFGDIFGIYLAQTDYGHAVTMNCPNIYALITRDGEESEYFLLKTFTVVFTFAILGIMLGVILRKGYDLNNPLNFLLTSIWTVFTCLMFLCSMHERYAYLLDILLIIYVVLRKKHFLVAVLANLCSLRGYANFLFALDFSLTITSWVYVGTYVYLTWIFVREIFTSAKANETDLPGNTLPSAEGI